MEPFLRQYDLSVIKLIFIVSCFCIISVLFITYSQNNFYKKILNKFFISNNNLEQYLGRFIKETILPLCCSIIILSLSLTILLNRFFVNNIILNHSLYVNFILVFIFLIIFITIKFCIIIFLGFIYEKKHTVFNYIKVNILLIICLSIINLPLITLYPFITLYIKNFEILFLYFFIISFIIGFLLKFIFFITINMKKKILNYRIFLYFCIVEVVPYLIILESWKCFC